MKKIIEGKTYNTETALPWETGRTFGKVIIIIAGKNCTARKREPISFMERVEP